ncbi:hypothetical protein C0J52_13617 [Blattella germanica]|nr:hypothetical protein C0J52_13617 [Blattella germanica]
MELSETPKKKAPIVPGGYILVNEKWKESTFEKCLSGVGKAIYCDNLGAIDFYPSDHCPIIYINEGELLSGITYERKLEKMRKVSNTGGIIIADRNNFTIKHFSDLQDKCFAMDLILIPIGNVSELPQILTQMVVCNIYYSLYNILKQGLPTRISVTSGREQAAWLLSPADQ